MTKKQIIIFGLVVLIFLALGSYVLAQPVGTEATLRVTDGQVVVSQPQNLILFNRSRLSTLNSGDVLIVQQGDTIKVSAASSAELTMGDGTSAELFSDTILQVSELYEDDTNFRVRLTLLAGRTVNRVQRLLKADDAYEVQTPSSTASVRGTVFTVDVISNQETFVRVDEGVVAVQMGEQEVLVEAGFEVTAVTGQSLNVQPSGSNQSRQEIETAVDEGRSEPQDSEQVSVDEGAQPETNVVEEQDALSQPRSNQDFASEDDDVTNDPVETAVSTHLPTAAPAPTNTNTRQSSSPATATTVPSGSTSVPPTATSVPPTATGVMPSSTPVLPTATRLVPTKTPIPPTATAIPSTNTPVPPPPSTSTPIPPPPTNTPEPPPPPTDEPKVTLCHKGNTITVDQSSVQAHLDHGDYLGECHE